MIKTASANFYVGNRQPQKDAKFLASFDVDVAGIQEGHGGNNGDIRKALGKTHRLYHGNTFGAIDVPILTKRELNVVSFKSRQVSKRAEIKNIGMPRNAGILRFKKDGQRFCFINTHLNAAVQNRATGEPLSMRIKRVYEFTQSIIALERIIKNAKKRGEHVILTGDLNFRNAPRGLTWRYSPAKLFKRTDMKFRAQGLDYVAWSDTLRMSDFEVIPTSKHGGDHPWLLANFTVKRKS